MKIREEVFRTIIDCFKQHGASTIDTPVMEQTVKVALVVIRSLSVRSL
jgi:histidyl-tRNA synthetase